MMGWRKYLVGICMVLGTNIGLADEVDLVEELKEIPVEAEIMQRGVPIPITEELQNKLADTMKVLLQTCRVDSKTNPRSFRKLNKGVPFNWDRVVDPLRNASYIHVSLGKLDKLRAGTKTVYARELLLETPPGNWPKKYMVSSDGRSNIQFSKCSGLVVVDVICMPGILEHLPKDYGRACRVLPPNSSQAVK